jgi:MoaA/NifB/PqqE/SkfB family radical SAM enzyme
VNVPHEKFCVLPWISLEASPVGTVRPCCLAEEEILDNDRKKFELSTANFRDIQTSDYMYNLRTDFLMGGRNDTCKKCWAVEDAGGTSKRMHTLDRLKHIDMGNTWTQDAKPLMFLDLKLGNICNLKCRICGSWSSSQFATEELKFVADKKNSFHYQMLKQGAWPRENTSFWDQIDESLTDIRYLEFTGGEPFMIEEHFDMLQGIVDRGIAHQVEIHYNTNGTQYPEHAEDVWKHFKTVEIAFSIDDLDKRFEYQRTNANWKQVCKNLDRFRDLKEIHSNIKLQICTTINVFNVYYIDQVAKWIAVNKESFDFVYWNILHEIWYFSISRLPRTVKTVLETHLMTCDIPVEFAREFEKIIDFMKNGESSDGTAMLATMRQLDQRRNQNLAQVMPEWAEIIGYERYVVE